MSQPQQVVVIQRTSGLAIAGLVFSILGWLTCGLLSIPGAFFSFLALFDRGPKGVAVAGLIVGFPGVLFFVFVGFTFFVGLLGLGAAATSTRTEAPATTPASSSAVTDASPIAPLPDLTNEELNTLWWEVERSSSTISDQIGERYTEKGSLSDDEFVAKLGKEVRGPIADEWGITYDQLMRVFDAGETATWRTNAPPAPTEDRGTLEAAPVELHLPEADHSELSLPERVPAEPPSPKVEPPPVSPDLRTWQDASGNFSVDAELVEVRDKTAHLKKAGGEITTVPVARLSEPDRAFLTERWARRKKVVTEEMTTRGEFFRQHARNRDAQGMDYERNFMTLLRAELESLERGDIPPPTVPPPLP